MIGSTVLYNFPGQKTAKGREVIATLPATVMAVHEKEGTVDLMVILPTGVLERRNHVLPLEKRDVEKHKTEADFFFLPLSPEEQEKRRAAAKAAEIKALEEKLAALRS